MKRTAIVHIYHFIRMSHTEPSRFIGDDFDTLRRILILVKQYGFPGTYALKYDALMEPRFQALLKEYLDENDELGIWWEITEPLCSRAGVAFRDTRMEQEYDDRVDSAYSLGYTPEERKRIVDAYMGDFYAVYGKYPSNIGAWVLDSVTMGYARERYGVDAACICRDQIATDGFTLWGGWPNGVYYPSRDNGFLPAQSPERQLDIPVFRLLGPDLIYNFEAHVRENFLAGVCTLEPAWLPGRDSRCVGSYFDTLTGEPALGIGYAQVGQENNFLWENIRPGLEPQLKRLEKLAKEGKIRVETMGATARWFREQYRLTPPMAYQTGRDWMTGELGAQWYASVNYRVGLLSGNAHLRIRDWFLYREDYPCRYLRERLRERQSTFDALPLMFPQAWGGAADRPYVRLVDGDGGELSGAAVFDVLDDVTARARLMDGERCLAELTMDQSGMTLRGCSLVFDRLPVLKGVDGRRVLLEHEGFSYELIIEQGAMEGLTIRPEGDAIRLTLGDHPGETKREGEAALPVIRRSESRPVPPRAPAANPAESALGWGEECYVTLQSPDAGVIHYTLDGSAPGVDSPVYDAPIRITDDALLRAVLVTPRGQHSEEAGWFYRFGRKDLQLTSPTRFDGREVFGGRGVSDLLRKERGTTDYLDGHWRGGLEDIDVTAEFTPGVIESVRMGFLSHHRSGIVFPASVELYTGADREHLEHRETISMPDGPGEHEIERLDAIFRLNETIGAFRIVARRHERMPQWCTYRGTPTVFTMADCLIVRPGVEE